MNKPECLDKYIVLDNTGSSRHVFKNECWFKTRKAALNCVEKLFNQSNPPCELYIAKVEAYCYPEIIVQAIISEEDHP